MPRQAVLKLRLNPFSPNAETFEDLTIQVHVPYSKKGVHLLIQPNIVDYKESSGDSNVQVKQTTVSMHTSDTLILEFNFGDKKEQKFKVGDSSYVFLLQQIGDEAVEGIAGQKFPFFEFLAERQ